jgi:opacity protein-like surface antigen
VLTSRVVYSDLDAYSGETFARVDHSSGFFVKGFLGAGGITSGKQNDEDFIPQAYLAYSNTLSSASGSLGYANIDAGYTFLKAPGTKLGAFVGYNYYTQHVNTYSCNQIAGGYSCFGNNNFLGISQDDHFNSMRVGLSSQFMLTDRLKFTADAAYLPWVNFNGQDDHNHRELLFPTASSSGDGVMLESILGYDITNNWNIGIGGRYWAWNMRTGTQTFDYLGSPNPPVSEPARFTTERYGLFIQTSYHWGDTTSAASADAAMPVVAAAPMNWSGFYIGGHLGGGWSDDRWSDPFGSTPSGFGGINVAGFGDTTHATGPLGGGQIGANWQIGHWVLGVQADASAADLRGENTCFSGLGGVDCQHIVNSLGTLTGRLGFAWDRSLIYAKGGGAWTDTTYNLNANTQVLTDGTGSTNIVAGGWTVGAGLEYALTDHWTTTFEYDHIGIGSMTVPFPTVAVINTQNISIKQSIDLFRLGVNYKFDWAAAVIASN